MPTGLVFCRIAFASHVKMAGMSINPFDHSTSRGQDSQEHQRPRGCEVVAGLHGQNLRVMETAQKLERNPKGPCKCVNKDVLDPRKA